MRSPTRARLTLAALACGAALALVACGEDAVAPPLGGGTASPSISTSPGPSPSTTEAASTDPSPSASTSASSTPTPTAKSGGGTVTKGDAATGKDADAATKVAQTFVAGDNVATRTGNFSARDQVTASSCAWCADKKSFVRTIYAGGGRIEGELFTENTFTVTGPTKGAYTVVVSTTVSSYREINGAGKVTDSHGDRAGILTLQVSSAKVVGASWQPAR